MGVPIGRAGLGALALALTPLAAAAQTAPAPAAQVTLPALEVVGVSPLPGTGIDRDLVPTNVQSLGAEELQRRGSPSVTGALGAELGSVNETGSAADPFQPDLLYRGFTASPVVGTPEGLAVYQNGVRINEAFGDTVNWDLFPDIAVDRLDVMSGNPVFGLNALGGAVVMTMKTGFSYQGFESELAGGSFAQRSAQFQYGRQVGNYGAYIAARGFDEDGWRQFSPDSLRQLYSDIGAEGERATLHLSFAGADNLLSGTGPAPVQELAAGRSLVFTTPQSNLNQLAFVTLNGSYRLADDLSLAANAYRREFRQVVNNANTTNFTACQPANGELCQSDGTTKLTGSTGEPVPDISQNGAVPIGENDREFIRAVTWGGTMQATATSPLFGHDNHFVAGASVDRSTVDFQSTTEVGTFNSSLQLQPTGIFVFTPENSGFNATPVGLGATDTYYGLFAADTFTVTKRLAVTASGRFNLAQIDLSDHLGSNLSGNNRFSRFNPAIGATYKIAPAATGYFGYSEGNRAPTPSEIECSNPAQPCVLPSSLTSDPPSLKQVVSRTYETGLRGSFRLPDLLPGDFAWNFGLFRTDLSDDIYAVATSVSSGFFENIGGTRRQGIETGARYRDDTWSVYAAYSLVDATFRSAFTLPSPNNPAADGSGNIHVVAGDRLPGIPLHRLKLGADYRVNGRWSIGGALAYVSSQFFRGDELNQNAPLPGYALVNLHSAYRVAENFELFATLDNALDARYASFGTFGDPTGIGAPGVPAGGAGVDPRFETPGTPIAIFGGVRAKF